MTQPLGCRDTVADRLPTCKRVERAPQLLDKMTMTSIVSSVWDSHIILLGFRCGGQNRWRLTLAQGSGIRLWRQDQPPQTGRPFELYIEYQCIYYTSTGPSYGMIVIEWCSTPTNVILLVAMQASYKIGMLYMFSC